MHHKIEKLNEICVRLIKQMEPGGNPGIDFTKDLEALIAGVQALHMSRRQWDGKEPKAVGMITREGAIVAIGVNGYCLEDKDGKLKMVSQVFKPRSMEEQRAIKLHNCLTKYINGTAQSWDRLSADVQRAYIQTVGELGI